MTHLVLYISTILGGIPESEECLKFVWRNALFNTAFKILSYFDRRKNVQVQPLIAFAFQRIETSER